MKAPVSRGNKPTKGKYALMLFVAIVIFVGVMISDGNVAKAESESEKTIMEELRSNTEGAINILDLDVFEDFLASLDTDQQSLLPFSDLRSLSRT